MSQVIWILVNCNTRGEAQRIGRSILKRRLAACFDVISRCLTAYWWPPKSGKIETSKGATLIIATFRNNYEVVAREVRRLHSDELPFIGFIKIEGVAEDYLAWMKKELQKPLSAIMIKYQSKR